MRLFRDQLLLEASQKVELSIMSIKAPLAPTMKAGSSLKSLAENSTKFSCAIEVEMV